MIHAIIFSTSPSRLDIFLQSIKEKNVTSFEWSVLYKEDNNEGEYIKVFEKYDIISYTKEGDFKEGLLSLIGKGDNLVSFFKDTNYFFSEMPEVDIEELMKDDEIFCVSLGYGRNVKHDALNDVYNILLNEVEIGEFIKFNWISHYLTPGRPLELGQGHTFYAKEIYKMFKKWKYTNIQELEDSFENLDYYPKEHMCSFKNSIMLDVIDGGGEKGLVERLKEHDFSNIDRNVIKI